MRLLAFILLAASCPLLARGQEAPTPLPDTTVYLLDAQGVVVDGRVFRLADRSGPFAVSQRSGPAGSRATTASPTLASAVAGLPGVWVSDRGSYAQGERLLVRGMGWRAAFGVRGTHVILDGVPLTLSDGQTQLNVIDPALVTRVEVIRGPASVLWGSGSGGVLALSTEGLSRHLTLRASGGGYGRRALAGSYRDTGAQGKLSAWGSYLREDGYRRHSSVELLRGGFSASRVLGPRSDLSLVGLVAHMPRAESPGGITFDAASDDPRQTRPIVLERDASKAVTQSHLSARYERRFFRRELSVALHGGLRSLDNPIVPRHIDLNRQTLGTRIALSKPVSVPGSISWSLGVEGDVQRDDRLERANEGGEPGALVLTDQVETVRSGAAFGQAGLRFGRTRLSAALRGDLLSYHATPADAEESQRTIAAVSPAFGISYTLGGGPDPAVVGGYRPRPTLPTLVYVNVAGALDAPTTTELGNRRDGAQGFDESLEPERTWSSEIGARGPLNSRRRTSGLSLSYDLAVFVAEVSDLLVPFEEGEVTFYRNDGSTRHAGVELGIWSWARTVVGAVRGNLAYSWTRARFVEGAGDLVIEGNAVPGVPEHLITGAFDLEVRYDLFLAAEVEAASGYPADSRGEASTKSYGIAHLRVVKTGWIALADISVFAELRNAFDSRYTGSVVVNAFGGRYAEPGAGRHLLVGATVTL